MQFTNYLRERNSQILDSILVSFIYDPVLGSEMLNEFMYHRLERNYSDSQTLVSILVYYVIYETMTPALDFQMLIGFIYQSLIYIVNDWITCPSHVIVLHMLFMAITIVKLFYMTTDFGTVRHQIRCLGSINSLPIPL